MIILVVWYIYIIRYSGVFCVFVLVANKYVKKNGIFLALLSTEGAFDYQVVTFQKCQFSPNVRHFSL